MIIFIIGVIAGLNPLFGGSAFRTTSFNKRRRLGRLNPLFGGSAFRTDDLADSSEAFRLNPLFGGSAFRTRPEQGWVGPTPS